VEIFSAANLFNVNICIINSEALIYKIIRPVIASSLYGFMIHKDIHFESLYKNINKTNHKFIFHKDELTTDIRFLINENDNHLDNIETYESISDPLNNS
jgi:hypothetical protein